MLTQYTCCPAPYKDIEGNVWCLLVFGLVVEGECVRVRISEVSQAMVYGASKRNTTVYCCPAPMKPMEAMYGPHTCISIIVFVS